MLGSLCLIPLILFSSATSCWEPNEQSILDNLKQAEVESMVPMAEVLKTKGFKKEFWGEVYYLSLKGDLRAVFKPRPPEDLGYSYAEVAAYKASRFLGFPEIPPSLIREIKGKTGLLQLYVEPTKDATNLKNYTQALKKVSPEALANLKLFYFVFGQWDSGPHNILITYENDRTKLIAIDNEGIYQRQYVKYGELPFVRVCYSDMLDTDDWHLPFPYENAKIITSPTLDNLRKILGNKIPDSVLKNLSRNNNPIYYIIYKNSLWVQYHKGDPNFVISYTEFYPEKSILMLMRLNMKVLKEIFSEAKSADFLTKDYLQAILDRRDQVIAAYLKQRR